MGGQKPETNKNKISVGLLAHVDAGKTTLSEALYILPARSGKWAG